MPMLSERLKPRFVPELNGGSYLYYLIVIISRLRYEHIVFVSIQKVTHIKYKGGSAQLSRRLEFGNFFNTLPDQASSGTKILRKRTQYDVLVLFTTKTILSLIYFRPSVTNKGLVC
jgi:hypothetical protein